MENKEIAKIMDSDRWLLNNGLISDSVKNQLFFCGSIVHKDVQAVEVHIEPEKKLVQYVLYVGTALEKQIALYNKLSTSKSLFGMWRFKRLLKKEGSLDLQQVLNKFVQDYCGPGWSVQASILNFDTYVDSLEAENEDDGSGDLNRRPDNR